MALEKAADGCVRFEDFTNNPGFYSLYGWQYPLKKSSIAVALKRLRENGLIDFVDNTTLMLRLTDSGKIKALWTKMKIENEKWDGKWRLVIWDIPEKRRNARDLLRHQLRQLGFKKFQQSVWISKKNCTFLLREYINKVGIGDWVTVLESDHKMFNL